MTRNVQYFDRRRFLQATTAAAACGFVSSSDAAVADSNLLIDTHVYVGNWPLRYLSIDTSTALVALLRRANVTQAWAGTFDGIFHKDVHGANSRLVEACRNAGDDFLIPIGTVNPTLPDWEEDVRRCHETFKMRGIRLHPNYHGYALDDPRFARLLALAAERGLFVQLVVRSTNERQRYLTPRVSQVELGSLAQIVPRIRDLRLLVAGARPAEALQLHALLNGSSAYFDFAQSTDDQALRKLMDVVSANRIVYGSAAPLKDVTPGANLQQGASEEQVRAICSGNAQRLMG